MTFLKKTNFKVLIFTLLMTVVIVYGVFSTINDSRKARALDSTLTSLSDTIQYQKFFTIDTPSSAPGGLNYLFYELPIRSSGTVLDPNEYLEVASITTETLQETAQGSNVFNVTNTINYSPSDITKASSTTTIGGNPGTLLRFSPGLPCDASGTASSCTYYTDPNTVPSAARTFTASPRSRARVSVVLRLKPTAPTSTNGLFITEANWTIPARFPPPDTVLSPDQWNINLNYSNQSSSSSVPTSSSPSSASSSLSSSQVASSSSSTLSSDGTASSSSDPTASSSSSSVLSSINASSSSIANSTGSSISSSTSTSLSTSSTGNSTSNSTTNAQSSAGASNSGNVSSSIFNSINNSSASIRSSSSSTQTIIDTVPRTGGPAIAIGLVVAGAGIEGTRRLSRRSKLKVENSPPSSKLKQKKSKITKK